VKLPTPSSPNSRRFIWSIVAAQVLVQIGAFMTVLRLERHSKSNSRAQRLFHHFGTKAALEDQTHLTRRGEQVRDGR
jgi:hypothetical protein